MITKKEAELHKKVQEIYKDPRVLLKRVWEKTIVGSPDPTPLQYDMLDFVCVNAPRRAILQAFRGCGKSWISCVAVVWYLIHNPTINVMVISASKDKSLENAKFIHDILNVLPELNHMLPHSDQRSSLQKFDISLAKASQSASVYCVGLEGQIEGKRADVILADDVEIAANSATKDQRQKLLYRTNEFESILKPDTKYFKTKVIMLGTPQTFESVYTELRVRGGYFTRIYPALRPSQDKIDEVYGDNLAPLVLSDELPIGESIEPARFTKEELESRALSKSYFQLHFLLDCTLSDEVKFPLKINDLIVRDVDNDMAPEKIVWGSSKEQQLDIPCLGFNRDRFYSELANVKTDHAEYEQTIMAIDPSGKGTDEMGWAVIKKLYGYVHIVDFGGLQGGFGQENLTFLAKTAKRYNVNIIVTESNFGGGMFTQLLRPYLSKYHRCGIEDVHSSKQKELRIIDTIEPLLGQHRLIIDKGAIERDFRDTSDKPDYSLIYQMSHVTRDRGSLVHDDRLDALAMACSFITDTMDVDSDELAWERELEEIMAEDDDLFGSNSPSWGDNYKI